MYAALAVGSGHDLSDAGEDTDQTGDCLGTIMIRSSA